jgi:hypothetical protein
MELVQRFGERMILQIRQTSGGKSPVTTGVSFVRSQQRICYNQFTPDWAGFAHECRCLARAGHGSYQCNS